MFTRALVFSKIDLCEGLTKEKRIVENKKSYTKFAEMSDLTTAGIKKLKVAELKTELSKRGLSTKGRKDDLTSRLLDALEGLDRTVAEEEDAVDDTEQSEANDSQVDDEQPSQDVNGAEEVKPAEVPLPDGDEEMAEPEQGETEDGAQPPTETAEVVEAEMQEPGEGEL